MADTVTRPKSVCLRCMAHEECIPTDMQLAALLTEDWAPEEQEFQPVELTVGQREAARLYQIALSRYLRAFGVEVTGAKLADTLAILRMRAKHYRISRRILEARSQINERALERLEVHDDEAAERIQSEPTPDYPGRAADDAWLREHCGYGIG